MLVKTVKHISLFLNDIEIICPNQVWATDSTYIRLAGEGFVYLMTIIAEYSRYLLSWRMSKTPELTFCQEALDEALRIFGKPAIINPVQGKAI